MRKPENKLTFDVQRAYKEQGIFIARATAMHGSIRDDVEHTVVIMDDSGMELFRKSPLNSDQFYFKADLVKITFRKGQPSTWLLANAELIT